MIDKSEFQRALGLKRNLFVDRMFELFDANGALAHFPVQIGGVQIFAPKLLHSAGDQSINFAEFVAGLSTFTTRAKPAEKAKFSFKMYDFNGGLLHRSGWLRMCRSTDRAACAGDELIDKQELGRMLQATIDENKLNISPAQAQQLIDDTFEEANTATPGYITFEEYSAMVSKKPQVHPCPLWVHLGLRLTQSRRPVQLLEFMTIQSLNSLIS